MKYIKLFEKHQTEADIHRLCDKYFIRDYKINPDMSIDVNGDVRMINRDLTELPLTFNNVYGNFNCYINKLTTLKGSPKYVGDAFKVYSNNLTSLEYSPETVEGGFYVSGNKLTTLIDIPKDIKGTISIYNNPLPEDIVSYKNPDDIKALIKYQDEYGIWNSDGSFNKGRYDIFQKDLKAGILE